MSDSQAYEELTVTSNGVSVVKRFEEDEFPVPAIAFEFTSSRDEEVRIVLRDTVPDNIEVEDLGFHPEYGSEHWVIDDDNTIAFEREIGAGESYTTVYGIRATGSDDVEQFLTEPAFDEVDPPLDGEDDIAEDVIPESDDDVVKEAIAGDGEIPGLEDEDEGEETTDEDVETLDLKDPNNQNATAAGRTTARADEGTEDENTEDGEPETESQADSETTTETTVDVDGDSLTASLAAEIRQQNVSAEDVKLLRRAFEIAGQDGGTTAAQIEQVQSDVSSLRAYTNALEEFLDENGTAQQVIEDFEEQVDTFEQQLSTLQSSLDENSEQLETVTSEVESFSGEISSISDEMGAVSDEIDDMTEKVESIDNRVDSVTDEMDTLSADVDDVSGQVDSMNDQFEDVSSTIDDLESEVESLEEDITDGEVAEKVDEIEEDIKELQTWQDQIKQTFGG